MSVDLHSHSHYSDGVLSPSDLVQLAQRQGCKILALSDHDTTAGIGQAHEQARLSKIKLIPAVEVSALWKTYTVHIVGLNVDIGNKALQNGLFNYQKFREIRAQKMAQGLENVGISGIYNDAKKLAPFMLTRTHFAQALIKQGICADMGSVFKRFLTDNKPGAVKSQWQQLKPVLNWIDQAGGISVLAHPFRYRFKLSKIRKLLADFKTLGGKAVEVVVSNSADDEIDKAKQFALEYDLLASVGSDYHGWDNQNRQLGRLAPLPKELKPVWQSV